MDKLSWRLVMTEPFATNPTSPSNDQGEVLLVVGVWRSGTSLLYALLNRHQEISLMYEGELPLLWPLFRWRGGRRWPERWNLWNQALTRHGLDATKFAPDVRDLVAACDAAYREAAKPKHSRFRGEKFPSYHDRLPALARLFPEAKFVLIWRSPLGICDSIARAGRTSAWNRRFGLLHRALFGCEQMLLGARRLHTMGVQVHHLRYRELLADAECELRKICGFLEIAYEPSMTELGEADRSAVYAGEHHKLLHSDRIHPEVGLSEALDPRFRQKIERYLVRWQRIYGDDFLADSGSEVQGEEPGMIELIVDRMFYRALRAYDFAVIVAFCFAPITWWRRYRVFKAARQQ
jgi:Sulfotransferase family